MSEYGVDAVNPTPMEDRETLSSNGSKDYDSNVTVDIGSWPEFGLRHKRITIECDSGEMRIFWRGKVNGTVEDIGEFTLKADESYQHKFGASNAYPDEVRIEEDSGNNGVDYVVRVEKL